MPSSSNAQPRGSRGVVVVHSQDQRDYASGHECATRLEIARRLAALKGFDFAGEYDATARYPGPVYFVPSNTLTGVEAAAALGVRDEHDLFGGVVPHSFVATKAITHPLVAPDAQAPAGWAREFGRRIEGAVLSGFTAFSLDDARLAGERLLEHGRVRIKPVRATGGRGQTVASSMAELDDCLRAADASELPTLGIVLEQDLSDVTTFSVGRICVADLVATYHGWQRLTPDNNGEMVYGGSELTVVRGDFDALLELELEPDVRLAVEQARTYDAAAIDCFTGFFASRRNYDIVRGVDDRGQPRLGVLEQSWRVGGATGAEITALETFRAEPGMRTIQASCVEVYGDDHAVPEHAQVYFRGIDERVGLLTKYSLIGSHANP